MADPFTFQKRAFKSKYSDDSSSDSDNSSEDELLLNPGAKRKRKIKRQTTIVSATSSRSASTPSQDIVTPPSPIIESKPKTVIEVVLSDSSDDESTATFVPSDAFQMQAMQQIASSRASRSKLYERLLTKNISPVKASAPQEDPVELIDIESDEDDPESEEVCILEAPESQRFRGISDSGGKKVQIMLRVGQEQEKPVMMAVARPFSVLKTMWCKAEGYREADVVFQFDGETLNLTDTPEDQDIEGGEIIDVKVKKGVRPQPPAAETPACKKVKILLRVGQEQAKPVMMAVARPFSVLKTMWCKAEGYREADVIFQFDGETLNLTDTPEDQDIEGGEIIDVKVKKGVIKSSSPSSSSSSSSSPSSSTPDGVFGQAIELRVHYKSYKAKPTRLKVREHSPLQVLFDGYSIAKKITTKQQEKSSLEFEKRRLDLTKSAAAQGISNLSNLLFQMS